MKPSKFILDPGWRVLLNDLEINTKEILKRAGMPGDLFVQKYYVLDAQDYFRLWNAFIETTSDVSLPLKMGQSISMDVFHPGHFAGLQSLNFNKALERLSKYKRLVGPLIYKVSKNINSTTIIVDCLDGNLQLPDSLVAFELVSIIYFARLGTGKNITPVSVTAAIDLPNLDEYNEYFGIVPQKGRINGITFSSSDAKSPFVKESAGMWNFFEPDLRKRLSDLKKEESFATRVKSSLLELLPGGQATMDAVSKKLAVSKRTLQRRLSEESTTFNNELNKTREKLARHYLEKSHMPAAQISFLLGFEDTNSFFRAFHTWTGLTPKQLRMNANSPKVSN